MSPARAANTAHDISFNMFNKILMRCLAFTDKRIEVRVKQQHISLNSDTPSPHKLYREDGLLNTPLMGCTSDKGDIRYKYAL